MHEHDWIIEVLNELQLYAQKHRLDHLVAQLGKAIVAAKYDLCLAKVDQIYATSAGLALFTSTISITLYDGENDGERVSLMHQYNEDRAHTKLKSMHL